MEHLLSETSGRKRLTLRLSQFSIGSFSWLQQFRNTISFSSSNDFGTFDFITFGKSEVS